MYVTYEKMRILALGLGINKYSKDKIHVFMLT